MQLNSPARDISIFGTKHAMTASGSLAFFGWIGEETFGD